MSIWLVILIVGVGTYLFRVSMLALVGRRAPSPLFERASKLVVPAAFSGVTAAFILAMSRAIGETMIVAIAAGQQPRLTLDPTVPIETMTAYIVQVSLGDTPQGTLEYRTIFAVGMLLFLGTFILNLASAWLRERYREEYA